MSIGLEMKSHSPWGIECPWYRWRPTFDHNRGRWERGFLPRPRDMWCRRRWCWTAWNHYQLILKNPIIFVKGSHLPVTCLRAEKLHPQQLSSSTTLSRWSLSSREVLQHDTPQRQHNMPAQLERKTWNETGLATSPEILEEILPQPRAKFAQSCDPVLLEVNGPPVDAHGEVHVAVGLEYDVTVCPGVEEPGGGRHPHPRQEPVHGIGGLKTGYIIEKRKKQIEVRF